MKVIKALIVLSIFLQTNFLLAEGCKTVFCKTNNGIDFGYDYYAPPQVTYVVKLDSFKLYLQRSVDCGGVNFVTILHDGDTISVNPYNIYPNEQGLREYKLLGTPGKYRVHCISKGQTFQFEFFIVMSGVGIRESQKEQNLFSLFLTQLKIMLP